MKNTELQSWVNQYTNELYKWALHKTSSALTAEDLIQDTFLVAAEKMSNFKRESSPKTWLFSILNHKIIDYYRKSVHKPVSIENSKTSTFFNSDGTWLTEQRPQEWHEEENHLLDNIEFNKVLEKCLNALPEKWNICVKLKYLSGKNGKDICQELDITPTNFWQIVHRAKLQLRDCIDNNWFMN